MSIKKIHLITFGILVGIVLGINSNEAEVANAYVDALLSSVRKEPQKAEILDPLYLPEIVDGMHTLRDIKVAGMSSAQRDGDVMVMNTGGMMFLIADIVAKNVSISMDCSSKMLFFEVNGDSGFVYDELFLRLILSESKKNFTATLLKVTREGNYYVKYNGYIMIGSLNVDLNSVLQNARETILSALESEAKGAFNSDSTSLLPYLDERFKNSRSLLLD